MTAATDPTQSFALNGIDPTEVFKALGDPVRWSIVQQMAAVAELPCATLEDTLPVSKPTISYHTKILVQAGLIDVRKQGRNYFYTLRREVLRLIVSEVGVVTHETNPARRPTPAARLKAAVGDDSTDRDMTPLTW